MPKRDNYINWDEYFMGVALLSGERSKDPNSQVGACIVSEDNKILSIGYNGFPRGCSKAIIQSGIKEVIYKSDKYADTEVTKISKKMLEMSDVKYRQYIASGKNIVLDL